MLIRRHFACCGRIVTVHYDEDSGEAVDALKMLVECHECEATRDERRAVQEAPVLRALLEAP